MKRLCFAENYLEKWTNPFREYKCPISNLVWNTFNRTAGTEKLFNLVVITLKFIASFNFKNGISQQKSHDKNQWNDRNQHEPLFLKTKIFKQ